MKVAIGKIGKSVTFGDVSSLRSAMTSGAVDAPRIFRSLIRRNPDVQFYMLGRSNLAKLSSSELSEVAPAGNLVDVWAGYKKWLEETGGTDNDMEAPMRYIENWRQTSGVKLDFGVFLPGNVFTLAVNGKSRLLNGGLAAGLVASSRYTAPMFVYMNETRVPYTLILTDPRTWKNGRNVDLFYPPVKILSQMNEVIKTRHRDKYDTIETVSYDTPAIYSGVETLYLMEDNMDEGSAPKQTSLGAFFSEPEEEPTKERDIKFMIFLNQGEPSRYPDVLRYVHDVPNDVVVYGNWDEEHLATGKFANVPMSQFDDEMSRTRYTLCVPIKKGWATGKFWDMMRRGIIPFVTEDYDVQRNIGFPEFLRVKNGVELREKMDSLDADPAAREKLSADIAALVKPSYRDGSHIADVIMETVREHVETK